MVKQPEKRAMVDKGQQSTDKILSSDITFSEITSGNWSITMVNPDTNETLERIFYLVAAATERVTTTVSRRDVSLYCPTVANIIQVTPTVIVGYTSTPLGSSKNCPFLESLLAFTMTNRFRSCHRNR